MKTSKEIADSIAAVSAAMQDLRAVSVLDYFINTTLHDSISDRLAEIGDEASFGARDDTALGRLGSLQTRFKAAVARAKDS